MIVCNKDIIKNRGIMGAPDLIIEVLSPGTTERDRGYKKGLYEKCGIKEYMIVDIGNRTIDAYYLNENKYSVKQVFTLDTTQGIKPLLLNSYELDLNDVFAGLLP